jgi:hypothetical protein
VSLSHGQYWWLRRAKCDFVLAECRDGPQLTFSKLTSCVRRPRQMKYSLRYRGNYTDTSILRSL